MWLVAAVLSFAFVRTGTFDPMACLRSALSRSSGFNSGLFWQVEQFDLLLVLGYPCLDRLAVMHSEIVENQKHLLAGFPCQRFEKLDQPVGN